jgi:hypothetical protein
VHADHAVGSPRDGGERRDRDRRRVRREHGVRGKHLVGPAEDVLLHGGVLDDRLDQQVGGDEVVDRRHPGQCLVRVGAALLGELRQALAHGVEPAVDRAWGGVVERDAAAGGGDHLRDSRAHLARPDHEDVAELHGAGG